MQPEEEKLRLLRMRIERFLPQEGSEKITEKRRPADAAFAIHIGYIYDYYWNIELLYMPKSRLLLGSMGVRSGLRSGCHVRILITGLSALFRSTKRKR